MNAPDAGDYPQVLLFKIATSLQSFSGMTAFFNDPPQVLLYKIALGVAAISGSSSGGSATAPAGGNLNDASMFPNGVFPATGSYFALDANFEYTYLGGESSWKQATRAT